MPSKLAQKLKTVKVARPKFRDPVWRGPEVDGVTQSLLNRFLCCRERFRLMVVEGLRAADKFYAPIEYGNMWHAAEEALAAGKSWQEAVGWYCRKLILKYPMDRQFIDHWNAMCLTQFPAYLDYWAKHPDHDGRKTLFQEQVFDVPYRLPSGRTVRMRGKWDGGSLIKEGVWLDEHKTKSSVDGQKIARQLTFDLQTMFYLVALESWRFPEGVGKGKPDNALAGGLPVKGVRYNVVRRSSHKTPESMLKKLQEDVADGRGGEWFGRWKVEVTPADVQRFRRETLDPTLDAMCDWWSYITGCMEMGKDQWYGSGSIVGHRLHWRHPFGVRNILDEGGSSDYDAYLETGSEAGLRRVTTLFEELQ